MNRLKTLIVSRFIGVCAAALLVGAALISPSSAKAQLHGIGGNLGVFGTNCLGQCVAGLARAGDTVFFQIQAVYTDSSGLSGNGDRSVITNVTVSSASPCLSYTSANLLTLNAVPPVPAGNIVGGVYPVLSFPGYPSYQPVNLTNPACGDLQSASVQLPLTCGGWIDFVGNIQAYDTNNVNGQNVGGPLGAQPSANIFVVQDCLQLTKSCTNGVGENGLITWTGTVKNCGNANLDNVVVTDFFNGTSAVVFGPATLTNGEVRTFSGSYHPNDVCKPSTDTLVGVGTDILGCSVSATNVTATCSLVLTPCIGITKTCDSAVAVGGIVNYGGTITNCGDVTLTNIVVLDTVPGVQNNVQVFGPVTLAPHTSTTYTGQYTVPADYCGSLTNTVTVTAKTICGGDVAPRSASCSTTVTISPCIGITKTCDSIVTNKPGGTTVHYSGVITNCGNVTLTNVIVRDTVPGVQTDVQVFGPATLAPHASTTYSSSYPVSENFCENYLTNTVTVTSRTICGGTVPPQTASCRTYVQCVNPPDIDIFKGVACAPAAGIAGCDGTLTYGATATGVAGTNKSAFCYQIIVVNTGSVVLTNVNVVDTLLGALSGYPTTLAIGERKTNYTSASWGVGTHTNTATVTGYSAQTGEVTNAVAKAVAVVVPASVSCSMTLDSAINVNTNGTGDCPVTLPAGSTNSPVTVTITVKNTGQAMLDVRFIGGTALSLVDCADDVTPLNLGDLVVRIPAGGTFTTNGCVLVSCPGATITATVQGTAVATTEIPCVYDSLGNAIKTAASSCSECVDCSKAVQCRVTGGGVLSPDNTDQSCILMVTTLSPSVNGTGLTLDKVTHGGQLGAPFSDRDCGEILGNPCIRGQWQHVRHYQGRGHPRDTVTAFHSNTPKGQFDTLLCACLGCCDPVSGGFIPPASGGKFKKFALCNPEDHRICGPMPRPAPANSIIFTGIGSMTPASDTGVDKKNAQWVVFRVYIEDRSEPGGNKPNGAIDPSDVYCFQAWYTGISVSKKPDYTTIMAAFRQTLGGDSCAFLDALGTGALPIGSLPNTTVGGLPADIVDQGPLYSGNQQIHPATGATCQ